MSFQGPHDSFQLGHPVINTLLEEVANRFSGSEWGANGPGLLTKVMREVCGLEDLEEMSPDLCQGVTILPQNKLYAVNWRNVNMFFDKQFSRNITEALKESYVAHLWGKHSSKYEIIPGSDQPILSLARQNCPETFRQYFREADNKLINIINRYTD